MAKTNQTNDHILHAWEQEGYMYLYFPFCIVTLPMEQWEIIKKDLKILISRKVPQRDVSPDDAG